MIAINKKKNMTLHNVPLGCRSSTSSKLHASCMGQLHVGLELVVEELYPPTSVKNI